MTYDSSHLCMYVYMLAPLKPQLLSHFLLLVLREAVMEISDFKGPNIKESSIFILRPGLLAN
jgi:hypothetical protein